MIKDCSKIARTGVAMLGKQDETTKAIKDLSGRVEQGREEIVAEIKSLK